MNLSHWVRTVIPFALLVVAVPAFGERHLLVGVGPDIGLWDVADGHHAIGLHTCVMLQFEPDHRSAGFRLDASSSKFWAEGNVGNTDLGVLAFMANLVVTFALESSPRPYWTLGIGYNTSDEGAQETTPDNSDIILGTGVGLRLGWGVIEARFDVASTSAGEGAHVPIFVAFRF